MKAANELYKTNSGLSYDEILQITKQARESRSEFMADFFSGIFGKVSTFSKKVLHLGVNEKYANHERASLS